MPSRVDLYAQIREDRRADPQVSIRTLQKRHRVSFRTVREALCSALPPPRKTPPPRASVLNPATGWIDQMLLADLDAPRKQRHTIRRVFERLACEHGFTAASYTTVRTYVNRRRGELVAERRGDARMISDGMVPQIHLPGTEAEVDFCSVWVRLDGVACECQLFSLRLSHSGKAVHRMFATGSQEAFLEGHVQAFGVLGGLPWRHIRYDNLKAAVKQVCFGRTRIETQRWTAFRSHYGFEAFYCLPGVDGAHEKGGVENEGGRFRRHHLVPVPEVGSLAELNERLAAIDAREDERVVEGAKIPVRIAFAAETPLLRALPDDDFDCGVTLTPIVRPNARITVRQCYYSVPARFIGRRVRVSLRANELLVFDARQVVARHPRQLHRFDFRDDLDHFLEILLAKPGALAGSSALATARAEGTFTDTHQAFWDAAVAAHGTAAGTRALIEVLLLHRHRPTPTVIAGMTAALAAGSTSPELVALEARKAAGGLRPATPVDLSDLGLGETTDVAWQALTTRPTPSVAIYDQLLTHHRGDQIT